VESIELSLKRIPKRHSTPSYFQYKPRYLSTIIGDFGRSDGSWLYAEATPMGASHSLH